jgi:ribosomal-protein-serine acetyltransferase
MLKLPLIDDVHLRLLEERDAGELAHVVDANREYLARWLPWAATSTEDSILEFIRCTRRQLAENNGLQTAIVIDGRIAGCVGVHGISWMHESTEIGYWLAEGLQGRGVMTAAVRAYTDHAFHVWGLHRMVLQSAVHNASSRAIAERLGFQSEGVLRQSEKVGERRYDIVVYSMLAPDWRAGGSPPGPPSA